MNYSISECFCYYVVETDYAREYVKVADLNKVEIETIRQADGVYPRHLSRLLRGKPLLPDYRVQNTLPVVVTMSDRPERIFPTMAEAAEYVRNALITERYYRVEKL